MFKHCQEIVWSHEVFSSRTRQPWLLVKTAYLWLRLFGNWSERMHWATAIAVVVCRAGRTKMKETSLCYGEYQLIAMNSSAVISITLLLLCLCDLHDHGYKSWETAWQKCCVTLTQPVKPIDYRVYVHRTYRPYYVWFSGCASRVHFFRITRGFRKTTSNTQLSVS